MLDTKDFGIKDKVSNRLGISEEEIESVSVIDSYSSLRWAKKRNGNVFLQQMYRVRVILKNPILEKGSLTREITRKFWIDVPTVELGE